MFNYISINLFKKQQQKFCSLPSLTLIKAACGQWAPLTSRGQGRNMNAGASLRSLPSSFQARHQPVAPHHPSDIGRYIQAEGGKGFPPALEAEQLGFS